MLAISAFRLPELSRFEYHSVSKFSGFDTIVAIAMQGCVFTKDINKAVLISDAMETGTVQINSAPARGPDHFPFQVRNVTISSSRHILLFRSYNLMLRN